MHQVQKNVENAAALEDSDLIEAVVQAWEVVCEENESHKHLVSEGDFQQWVNFRDETALKLHEYVDFYEGTLSEDGRAFFQRTASMIAQARHKSEKDILDEASRKTAVETERGSAPETKQTVKENWLRKISRWFK